MQKVRFDHCIKLCRFKEFRFFLPKIYELPIEKIRIYSYNLQVMILATLEMQM